MSKIKLLSHLNYLRKTFALFSTTLLLFAAFLVHADSKIGINLNFRTSGIENGTGADNGSRPWALGASITDQASLQAAINNNTSIWNPSLTDDLGKFSVLRPLEWIPINSNPISTWDETANQGRRKKNEWPQVSISQEYDYTDNGVTYYPYQNLITNPSQLRDNTRIANYGGAPGVAWEWIADIAKRTNKELWINVPHLADDNYVTKLATLIRDQAGTGTVYVEFSNEYWNSGNNFRGQYYGLRDKGRDTNLTGDGQSLTAYLQAQGIGSWDEDRARDGYYAWRSVRVWKIFKDTFGTQSPRLKFVLAGLINQDSTLKSWKLILQNKNVTDNIWPDYLARGWYIGIGSNLSSLTPNSDQWWTTLNAEVNKHFGDTPTAGEEYKNVGYSISQMNTYFNNGAPKQAQLTAYEFGIQTDLEYTSSRQPSTNYNNLTAYRDNRMYQLWRDVVSKGGAKLAVMNLYCYTSGWNVYNSIPGLKEFVGQADSSAPMWQGAMQGIADLGTTPVNPTSLVSNGGFETGVLTNWDNWGNAAQTTDASSGTKAIVVGTGEGGFGQTFDFTAGGYVSIAIKAKTSGSPSWAGVGIRFINASGTQLQQNEYTVNSTAYASYGATSVAVPANTARIQAYGWKSGTSGYLYADDFVVTSVVAPAVDDVTGVTYPSLLDQGNGTATITVNFGVAGAGRHLWAAVYDANWSSPEKGKNQVDTLSSSGTATISIPYTGLTTATANVYVALKSADWSINLDTDSKSVAVSSQSTFNNNSIPWAVSSSGSTRIQAEDFNQGGNGVAYSDTDTMNMGGQYRTADQVDIEATTDSGAGYNVGWIKPSEYLQYTVNVASAGSYSVRLRTARQIADTSSVKVSFADAEKASLTVNATGGWQNWQDSETATFNLAAGTQILRLDFIEGDFNLNWIEIVPAPVSAPASPNLDSVSQNSPILVSWSNVNGESGYDIDRAIGTTGAFGLAATVSANVTSWQDINANTNGTIYRYRVRSKNAVGSSANSQSMWLVRAGANTVIRELWSNLTGSAVSSIPVANVPNSASILTSLTVPQAQGDNYGVRIRGYIVPAVTGSYTFWVAGDENAEFWLSSSNLPSAKLKIAYTAFTNYLEWNKYATQKSTARTLTAGQKYYFEILQKEGTQNDHVSVGWAKPGQATTVPSEVIPASSIAPY